MTAASEELLKQIHDGLAKNMLARLEMKDENGKPIPLTPAEMSAYAKFLKDNNIQADPEHNETTKKVAEKTANILDFPFQAPGGA